MVKPTANRVLAVGTLVKSHYSYAGHSPTYIGQEHRAVLVSKDTHTVDDGQLANHIGPALHKSPISLSDGPCVSELRRRQ